MKRSLFRYISSEYAVSFVYKGEMLFRTLSYYRDYEGDGVRADDLEGIRIHLPSDGLKVTKQVASMQLAESRVSGLRVTVLE
jgi:hypothetical protein